jgi:hypothetical protein
LKEEGAMSRPTAKRVSKKPPVTQRRPAATARPDALGDAELDGVVGGRQTPRTDFGSVLGRGLSKAADVKVSDT